MRQTVGVAVMVADATREALGLAFAWSAPVSFLARFMTVYA